MEANRQAREDYNVGVPSFHGLKPLADAGKVRGVAQREAFVVKQGGAHALQVRSEDTIHHGKLPQEEQPLLPVVAQSLLHRTSHLNEGSFGHFFGSF